MNDINHTGLLGAVQPRRAYRRRAFFRTHAGRRRLPSPARAAARVPIAAWICALTAFLNATAWSIVIPPFQGRDEIDHFAYVAQLAETGTLPHPSSESHTYPLKELLLMEGLRYPEVRFTPYNVSLTTAAQQATLINDAHARLPTVGTGVAGGASSEPPLFYAMQVVPYELGRGNMLLQLQFMRLLAALMGAATALLTFLFLREALQAVPAAATLGAICVALQPEFAFVSGSLNPDALLYAICAAVFLCLARAFRRRLTLRLAVALGLLLIAGLLTYFSFLGFALGALIALALLVVRDLRHGRTATLRRAGLTAAIAIVPVLLYALRNIAAGRPTFGFASQIANLLDIESLSRELSYMWQLFLPRLPGMTHYFYGVTTWRDIWFDRSVGLYGWMDTTFPTWVDNVALFLAVAILLLCARAAIARRDALRGRLAELGAYGAIVIGVLAMVGAASYTTDIVGNELAFGESRYLLPMLPLLGGVVALAIRGAGRRWMPVAGVAIVLLFLGHDVFSQLQTVARYYG